MMTMAMMEMMRSGLTKCPRHLTLASIDRIYETSTALGKSITAAKHAIFCWVLRHRSGRFE